MGFLDKLVEKAEEGLDKAAKVCGNVGQKVDEKLNDWETRLESKLEPAQVQDKTEELYKDKTFKEYFNAVVETAKGGRPAVADKLKEISKNTNAKLDAMLTEHPYIVGGVDGFACVFTKEDKKRSPISEYRQGIGVGKAVGYSTAVIALLEGGLLLSLAGAYPFMTRVYDKIAPYVRKKVDEAKAEIEQSKGTGKKNKK